MRTLCRMLGVICLLAACKGEQQHHAYRKDIVDAVYASGYLVPEHEYRVYAQAEGLVLQRMADEGDTIKAGQLLYRIDGAVAEAREAAATAALRNALTDAGPQSTVLRELEQAVSTAAAQLHNDSLNNRRYEHLWNQKAVARADYDRARLQYLAARNDYEAKRQRLLQERQRTLLQAREMESRKVAAEQELKQTAIRSAINGRVFELLKQPGEVVKQHEWIATLGLAGKAYAQLWVDENDFSRVHTGQLLWMKVDAFPGQQYRARVRRIYPAVQRERQSFRVDADVLDALPAQVAYGALEANIIVQEKKAALVVPKAWLAGNDSIQVKAGGKKVVQPLQKGIETMDEVEVKGGIDEHTVILTAK